MRVPMPMYTAGSVRSGARAPRLMQSNLPVGETPET